MSIRINKYKGLSVHLSNGLSAGFNWTHDGNGDSSKADAVLASYHPPTSPGWRWVIYWIKPKKLFRLPSFKKVCASSHYGRMSVNLPLLGGFDYTWQK